MQNDYTKTPRLYTPQKLERDTPIVLSDAQNHYLRSVIRLSEGDPIRLFNGADGEWAARLLELSKKQCRAAPFELLKPQPPEIPRVHLLFAPFKKHRMDVMIEKSVELGVTDLHPVLTARTEIRTLNEDRLRAQITEASEQCERMDLPRLHSLQPLAQKLQSKDCPPTVLWGRERGEAVPLADVSIEHRAFLIGPEGGFDDRETTFLESQAHVKAISMGPQILRCETAALAALAYILIKKP
jgi:16S rRNA (uracil1498-N3)-methyltransferase